MPKMKERDKEKRRGWKIKMCKIRSLVEVSLEIRAVNWKKLKKRRNGWLMKNL